jgi:8-oxo-dGTP diphosphatase
MTDAQRSAAESGRYKVTGDVHLVLLDDDGQVLLGRRKNTGFADGCYHLPAGHLEAGESVIDALVREAREETGIVISSDAIDFAHVMHNSSGGGRVAFFFTVRRWDGIPQNREPHKCSELRWAPLNALPGNLVDYCRSALAAIADGKPFSLSGWQNSRFTGAATGTAAKT